MSIQPYETDAHQRYQVFLESGQSVQTVAAKLGVQVQTVLDPKNPNFQSLPPADQVAVIERLKVYRDLLELSASNELLDEKRLLWFALNRLRMAPPSDLLDQFGEDDLVEVYVGSRQVYRSFNYYNYCSYSLDELECVPWNLLFARDEKFTQQIILEMNNCLATRETVLSKVPVHEVQEVRSVFRNKFAYQLKKILPLKDLESNRQDCFIAFLTVEKLEQDPHPDREQLIREYFERRLKELKEDL